MDSPSRPIRAAQPFRVHDWPAGEYRVLATDIWGRRYLHPKAGPWAATKQFAEDVMKKRTITPSLWGAWLPQFGTPAYDEWAKSKETT